MNASMPGRSAMAPLIAVALTMRLFWGMTADFPYALNAAWLCPLIGLVICLPFLLALHQATKLGSGSIWDNLSRRLPQPAMRAASLLLTVPLLFDAAINMRLSAASINFIALNDASVSLLILPLGIVVLVIALFGGDVAGNSVRIWLRLLPFFVFLVLLVQFRHYNVGWLAPLLGNGMGSLLSGGIYCAGNMALLALLWVLALPDRNRRGLLFYILIATICASLLVMTQQMLSPVLLETELTHTGRVDLILSNGRSSLSSLLVLDVLWFGNLLYLLGAEIAGATALIRWAFPKFPAWCVALAEALLTSTLAILNESILSQSVPATSVLFPLIGGSFVLLLLFAFFGKEAKTACDTSN